MFRLEKYYSPKQWKNREDNGIWYKVPFYLIKLLTRNLITKITLHLKQENYWQWIELIWVYKIPPIPQKYDRIQTCHKSTSRVLGERRKLFRSRSGRASDEVARGRPSSCAIFFPKRKFEIWRQLLLSWQKPERNKRITSIQTEPVLIIGPKRQETNDRRPIISQLDLTDQINCQILSLKLNWTKDFIESL